MTARLERWRGPVVAGIVAGAALPSLIGTAPANPIWSPDDKRIAFLPRS